MLLKEGVVVPIFRNRRHRRAHRSIPRLQLAEPLEQRLLLAKTIFVDVNASELTHDGTTWATPSRRLFTARRCRTACTS